MNNVTFKSSAKTILVDESSKLEVIITPADATDQTLHWSTSDDSVVTVDQNGEIKGVASGQAIITVVAQDGGFKDNCTVTVKENTIIIPVEGLCWSATGTSRMDIHVAKGANSSLSAYIVPDNATNQEISWQSSNSDILTVSQDGSYKALENGDAVIIVTSADGGFTAICDVVISQDAAGITLDKTALEMVEFEQQRLEAKITPDDARDKTIEWSSTDDNVATVAYGIVTAKQAGSCKIIAKHGDFTAECSVSVTCPVSSIDFGEHSATMKLGDKKKISATIIPARATDRTLLWSSDKPDVASVDDEGCVTANATGTATIVAISNSNSSASALCKITVVSPVSSFALDQEEMNIYLNESQKLTPIFTPTTATQTEVTWTSRDPGIASVDASGNVTAHKFGDTEIYAVCKSTGEMAFCRVHTFNHVSSIEMYDPSGKLIPNDGEVFVYEKEEIVLSVILKPEDSIFNKKVIWTSDNSDLVVSQEGRVRVWTTGGRITATSEDNEKSTSCIIRVSPHVEQITLNPSVISSGFFVGDAPRRIEATVFPSTAKDKSVTWESSNPSIVAVKSSGDGTAEITPVSSGEADIICTSVDGGKKASCHVTVLSHVEGVKIIKDGEVVNDKTFSVTVGDPIQLTSQVLPDDAKDKSVIWESSNTAYAKVSSDGRVTAVAEGVSIITASSKVDPSVKASCIIDVRPVVNGITLNKEEITINKGEGFQLEANVLPQTALNRDVTWQSTRTDMVEVSDKGYVKGLKSTKGDVFVVAYASANKEIYKKCRVTVITPVTEVTLDKPSLTMSIGGTEKLVATVIPEDADNKSIRWESSDPAVVTVSDQGDLHALKIGDATISAISAENEEKIATCTVTVIEKQIPVASVKINSPATTLDIKKTMQLSVTVLPVDATNKLVDWTSSNPSVATVSDNGLVTAIAEGEVKISATSKSDPSKKDECTIKIVDPSNIKVKSITLSPDKAQTLEVGSTLVIKASVLPDNAANKKLDWSSSNPGDVSIADNGDGSVTVTGNKVGGDATITATATDGSSVSSSVRVSVIAEKIKVTGIEILYNGSTNIPTTIAYNEEIELTARIYPDNATVKDVVWEKNKASDSTITPNGNKCIVKGFYKNDDIIVYAYSADNREVFSNCLISVGPVELKSISFAKQEVKLTVGKTEKLEVNFNPYNATDKSLNWFIDDASPDKSSVTVDSNGTVKALAPGTAKIWAKSKTKPDIEASCTITVVSGSGAEDLGFEDWN